MERDEAARLLGVPDGADQGAVRAAYRRQLLEHHPDRHAGSADAAARTRSLIDAYGVLAADGVSTSAGEPGHEPPAPERPAPGHIPADAEEPVRMLGDDTIELACPGDEAFVRLVEVGHVIGDVTYVDRITGLLELLVRTPEGHALSLVTSLQGRANGCTEVFVTLEPIGVPDITVPPVAEATALLAHHLAAGHWR